MTRFHFGLRALIALALIGVFALVATLALFAAQPLVTTSGRLARQRLGLTLARAVAGEVALTHDPGATESLLAQSVGAGGLTAAALVGFDGLPVFTAGSFTRRLPRRPAPEDAVRVSAERMVVTVLLPSRGLFFAETSLAPSAAERAVPRLIVMYSAASGILALVAMYLLLTVWIVRPMEAITVAAERMASGRRDVRAEARGAAEVVRTAEAFNRMTDTLRAREEELSRRVRELERATRELSRAQEQVVRGERLAMVGRLSAGIAHEVGNPLAAIVGLTEVLKEGGLEPEETQDFVTRIGREAQRIHRTVRELLDYARATPGSEEGAGEHRRDATGDAVEAVEQVTRLLRPQKNLKDIVLSTRVGDGISAVPIATDRLVQVVLNLVLNAADAVASAGGSAIAIELSSRGDRVSIAVEDDGTGISEDLRAKIFEPFFTTRPAGEGTGLGLATSAAIIEQAGGTIRALPRADGGRGARMQLDLPYRASKPPRESLVR